MNFPNLTDAQKSDRARVKREIVKYILGFSTKSVLESVPEIFELSEDEDECIDIGRDLCGDVELEIRKFYDI